MTSDGKNVRDRRYSIKKNRLDCASYKNMAQDSRAGCVYRKNASRTAFFVLPAIDGADEDSTWGRLSMNVSAEENVLYIVHVFALNDKSVLRDNVNINIEEYLADSALDADRRQIFFENAGEIRAINSNDILLYSLSGRFLWVFIEVQGEGNFSFSDMRIDMVGDNFMATFPQIYRERNSFFHRYISIFSSIYNDFQAEIDNLSSRFDSKNAPCEFLVEYMSWLGMDISREYVDDDTIRKLAAEAFELKRYRGTRYALERVGEILLGEKPVVIERGNIDSSGSRSDNAVVDELYGKSPYDVTVLTTVECGGKKRKWLSGFMEKFLPVRCRLKLIFLIGHNKMDAYTYMGVNATLWDTIEVKLDDGVVALDEMGILK